MDSMIRLNDGNTMPALGYGTYKVLDPAECEACVLEAIRTGYRLIDTATYYDNEEAVGRAIARAISEGLVSRKDLFITTKVWFTNYEDAACRASLEASLVKLGLDTIDLVLLHWPYGNVYAAWRVLEEYKKAGRIASIGVSNMNPDRMIDLMFFNQIPPAVNQVEGQLYCQRTQERAWMEKYHVVPQAFGPLGQGKNPALFTEPELLKLSEKYGKTPAQVQLRFLMQLGFSVIPKSSHAERIRENFDILDFSLTAEEMDALRALDQGRHIIGVSDDPEWVEKMVHGPTKFARRKK